MFISLEVTPPKRHVDRVLSVIREALSFVDTVNITDTPFGRPRIPSFVFAHIVKERFNADPIVHMKTINMNKVALKSILYGCNEVRLKSFLFIRGDEPAEGTSVTDFTPEALANWARSKFPGVKIGLAAGWPIDVDRLVSKLSVKPDFIFTQIFLSQRDAEEFIERFDNAVSNVGWRPPVYFTYLVHAKENLPIIKMISELMGQKFDEKTLNLHESLDFVEKLCSLFDGFMVSSPKSYSAAIDFLRAWKGA